VSGWDASAWADAHLPQNAPLPDCLLVLAGGVDDAGALHASVNRRLDAAVEVYRRCAQQGAPCSIIANGGGARRAPSCFIHAFEADARVSPQARRTSRAGATRRASRFRKRS